MTDVSMELYVVFFPLVLVLIAVLIRWPVIGAFATLAVIGYRVQEVLPWLYQFGLPVYATILALVLAIISMFDGRSKLFQSSAERTAYFFVAWTLITCQFSSMPSQALQFWTEIYAKVLIVALTVVMLVRQTSEIGAVSRFVAIIGTLVAGVGVYNWIMGIGLVEGTRLSIAKDLQSTLADPNDLALYLLLPLNLAISLLLRSSVVVERSCAGVGVVVMMAAILATQSRGGFLGLGASLALFSTQLYRSRLATLAGAVVLIAALYTLSGIGDRSYAFNYETSTDDSSTQRLELWRLALQATLDHPLTGIGFKGFNSLAQNYLGVNFVTHNTWLEVSSELGFVGLGLFVTMLYHAIATCVMACRISPTGTEEYILAVGLLATFAGFVVAATFISHAYTWYIYVLIALSVVLDRRIKAMRVVDLEGAQIYE